MYRSKHGLQITLVSHSLWSHRYYHHLLSFHMQSQFLLASRLDPHQDPLYWALLGWPPCLQGMAHRRFLLIPLLRHPHMVQHLYLGIHSIMLASSLNYLGYLSHYFDWYLSNKWMNEKGRMEIEIVLCQQLVYISLTSTSWNLWF